MLTCETTQDASRTAYEAHSEALNASATTLCTAAHSGLLRSLEGFGNVLSDDHKEALRRVCDLYARILYDDPSSSGRWAVSLDTGMGKTESVVAIIKAIADTECGKSVMVCQSTVEGLIKLKRRLVAVGVPAERIGVVHALKVDPKCVGNPKLAPDPGFASALSVPLDADYSAFQFLLVTHARTKGRALERCMKYGDGLRDLNIWDETMLKSEAESVTLAQLDQAVMSLQTHAKYNPVYREVAGYLTACLAAVETERARQESGGVASGFVVAPALAPERLDAYSSLVGKAYGKELLCKELLCSLLTWLSNGETCRVLLTDKPCLVQSAKTIPDALNMVILDASYNIHTLEKLDSSIVPLFPVDDPAGVKRYDRVSVFQMYAHSGKSSMGDNLPAIAAETAKVIQSIPEHEGVIVFTFKECKDALAGHLRDLGVSFGQTVGAPNGMAPLKPRINLLHWGQEKGLNDYGHCANVIMAGILHKPREALAGATIGQLDDDSAEAVGDLLDSVEWSEWSDCVFQAIGRSSCRHVVNGYADPAKVWLMHPDHSIRDILTKHMQGVRWGLWNPVEPERVPLAKTYHMAALIAHELETIPEGVLEVSSRKLLDLLGWEGNTTYKEARAIAMIDHPRWVFTGRSYRRVAEKVSQAVN